MKEELVRLETAKLAKEKGFDWETLGAWVDLTEFEGQITLEEFLRSNNHNKKGHRYSAPTQSLLQKWLRDVHGWHIVLIPVVTMHYTFKIMKVWKKDDPFEDIETPPYKGVNAYDYSTYEEALEAGLIEVLNLV